jgi:hypothetical protein
MEDVLELAAVGAAAVYQKAPPLLRDVVATRRRGHSPTGVPVLVEVDELDRGAFTVNPKQRLLPW